MINSIKDRLDKLDSELEEVIQKMKDSSKSLHNKPKEKWSPVQVLNHLCTSEQGTVNYLKKKVQSKDVPSSGIRCFFASRLLSRALKNRKKKYRAPKVLGEMPDKPDFEKVQDEYLKVRKELRSVLDRFDKKKARKAYFKHPIAGKLNIYQTLSFLENHFERHKEQIYERLS